MIEIPLKNVLSFSMGGLVNLESLPSYIGKSRQYQVTGRNSGDIFTFCASQNQVLISKFKSHTYHLESSVTSNKELCFHLYTRDLWNVRHPDLDASKFYDASVYYFAIDMGLQIDKILGKWNSGTNFLAYREAIRSGKTVERAAFSTWSGRKAAEHGYNRLEVVSKTDLSTDRYLFYFVR